MITTKTTIEEFDAYIDELLFRRISAIYTDKRTYESITRRILLKKAWFERPLKTGFDYKGVFVSVVREEKRNAYSRFAKTI